MVVLVVYVPVQADLLGIKQLSQQCAGGNHTVWLSHYPSSFITTNHNHLLRLLR